MKGAPLDCPKCGGAMEAIEFERIEFDRCTSCSGLWFDHFEKEDLLALKGSEVIDSGDPEVGARYNAVPRVACPRGHTRQMVRMVDFEQHHVWFEQCPVCGGSFLDAGEFRDLKKDTLLDWFRGLFAKDRSNPS